MPVRIQKIIAAVSILLFFAKMFAWYLTHSVAILTDALESTVNIITGFIGLYSVSLSAKPRDFNHPFGHAKAEYISSAVEGLLISIAGVIIIAEAVVHLIQPRQIQSLDLGMWVIGAAGVVNFFLGRFALREGIRHKSITVEASGKHLLTDAYSTLSILGGLCLLVLTGWQWLDSVVALIFSVLILRTGVRVLKKSLAGIMDESDAKLLAQVLHFLNESRRPQWIDMHNLRVIQYGKVMHIDAHMTLPWYYRVADAEKEIHILEDLIAAHFGNKIEIFVHVDACAPYSCKLCAVPHCPVRQEAYKKQLEWTLENIWADSKHGKIQRDDGVET